MVVHKLPLRIAAFLASFGLPVAVLAQAGGGAGADAGGIKLLEPIGGVSEIPVGGGGLSAFGFYFGLVYPWVVGMGAAIAVLMGVIGGIQMIQAGADSAAVSAGKSRLLASLGGLLLILLSATIMNALNPAFFK